MYANRGSCANSHVPSRRHILATTSQLQETVRCLENRISELEEALAQSHAMHSSSPHPLLQNRSPTMTQTPAAPSNFLPVPGQPSPPPATIASTSPPAYSPNHTAYNIDNTGSNAPRVHQPFSDVSRSVIDDLIKRSRSWSDVSQNYDRLELPQSSISSAGDLSSSSSVDFPPTFVSSSYTTTSDIRSVVLPQGQQQDRIPEPPESDLMYIYHPYYSNQWS